MARRPSIADRLYRALLRLLPAEFRGDFGDGMRADFDDRRAGEGDARAIRREAGPLLATAVREHLGILHRDVRDAVRTMRRAPGFTALAILMLALGTGVNVAMFSVIDAVMLRTPFVDRERIASVLVPYRTEGGGTGWGAAVPRETAAAMAAAPAVFEAVGSLDSGDFVLTGHGEPRRPRLECVSPSLFEVLGTRPLYGRVFTAADDRAGATPVVVISHDFASELGVPATLVGTAILLNYTPVSIIGVMPADFGGPYSRRRTSGWVPLHVSVRGGQFRGCQPDNIVMAFARVREGVTFAAAMSATPGVRLEPIDELTFGDRRTSFLILAVAVGCVLLIACLNVGGLQLERALTRRREQALRVALGASRARLIRQALTENLVLALAGAAAAVVATSWMLDTIVALLPTNIPHLDEIAINGRAIAAACAIAGIASLIAGLIPSLHTRRANPVVDLASSGRSATASGTATRRVLAVVEIALSVVVLIAAGLMIQTFAALRPSRPGFDPSQKLVTQISLQGVDRNEQARVFTELFNRIREIPGVRAVDGSSYLPLSGTTSLRGLTFEGRDMRVFTGSVVTAGYFDLMKIPIRTGRGLAATDTASSPRVVVVNEALASQMRPDGNVVGLYVKTAPSQYTGEPALEWQIVGVAGNTRSMSSNTTARPEYYAPLAQRPVAAMHAFVLTDRWRDPETVAAIRAAIRSRHPDMPQQAVQQLDVVINTGAATPRFGAWLLGVFAALAVTLAAIGLMTTMGWWVRQRARELGVRVALGASRAQIMRMVLVQGVGIAAAGIAAGVITASGVTRYLKGWIYGVTPLDPATFAGAIALMLLIALAAVYVPLRRALRIDPIVALRAE